jgi:hypothetical protein
VTDEDELASDPRHPRAQVGISPGSATNYVCFAASRWAELAHWIGGKRVIEQAVWFTLKECGEDMAFLDEMIEKVQPRHLPWKWRADCVDEFKRRRNAPRSAPKRFEEPTFGSLLQAAFNAMPPAEVRARLEKWHAEIAAKTRAGQEIVLYGTARVNRYRVVPGKTGEPDIIAPSGQRTRLLAEDLARLQE